ncbi:MAG: hypothetical protein H7A09_10155 [Oceanospirillaceae bacterium]|nr:hypothetical protein [Oceanospirillaceae bacterium]
MKRFWQIAVLLSFYITVQAVPAPPAESDITRLFEQGFGQELLFFMPEKLPLEIERIQNTMVKKLDQYVKAGVLTRENTRFLAEKIMYGEPREVSVGGYTYKLNEASQWVSPKGIYYGHPRIREILEVSTPMDINGRIYCEVYLSWYADQLPEWLDKIDWRAERALKRARESKEKPFEKRLNFEFKDGKWDIWKDKAPQTLF